MSAFDMVTAEAAYCALGSSNTRVHCLPTTLGIDYRIINGRVYIGGNAVTDPAEIARRTAEFQQRAFYYYANWERLYAQWREKMLALIRDAQALPKPELPEFEPLENVHAGRGIASNHYLLDTYQKTLEGYFRMWHHHFEFLLLGYGAYMTFFAFCKKAFPEITRPDRSRAWWPASRRRSSAPTRSCGAWRGARWSSASTPSSRRGVTPTDDHGRRSSTRGAAGQAWLEELADLARPVVQHQRRRWLLPLPPLLERRPVACRSRACPATSSACQGGRVARAADRASCRRERRQLIEDYRELLEHGGGARRLRSDDHARAPRVPVRRGAQVLLRALVHEPVLQQDPRVRRAARGARVLRRAPRTCSISRTTSSRPRSSTS